MSIYSLFSPSSSGGQGLRAPAPPPAYSSSGRVDYSLAPSGGSGGQGLQAPAPAPMPPSNIYTPPSYSLAPQGGSGGQGLQAPSFPTSAPQQQQSPAWWDAPAAQYQPQPSYNYMGSFTPSFSTGSGLGLNMPQGMGGGMGDAQLRAGAGAPGMQSGTFTGPGTAITAAPAQSGVTGGFGVTPQTALGQSPAMLADPLTPSQRAALTQPGDAPQGPPGVFQQGMDWLRDPRNSNMVRLGIQGLGALAGYRSQQQANQQIQQEMQRGNQAYESQVQANQQNQAVAQRLNQEAMQSLDEARSLYNPQEMAIRGLAQTRGTTQRNIAEMRRDLARRGLSPAAIEAEVRRAQVAGSAGESTAYARGMDVGRTAQQGALTAARGLTQNVPGLQYTPSASVANYYAQQGAATSQTLRDMLESYLGYPTLQAQEEARRQMQQRSVR